MRLTRDGPLAGHLLWLMPSQLIAANSIDYKEPMEWIEQGQSPAQAIQSAGWVQQRDVAWIENASASRLATLLRSIGDRNARDSSFNLAWAANLIFPIMILVLACVVTFYTEGFVTRVYALVTELAKL